MVGVAVAVGVGDAIAVGVAVAVLPPAGMSGENADPPNSVAFWGVPALSVATGPLPSLNRQFPTRPVGAVESSVRKLAAMSLALRARLQTRTSSSLPS